jgi:hypothetical protein
MHGLGHHHRWDWVKDRSACRSFWYQANDWSRNFATELTLTKVSYLVVSNESKLEPMIQALQQAWMLRYQLKLK